VPPPRVGVTTTRDNPHGADREWYRLPVGGQRERVPRRALPVSVILGISTVAAGVVHPVTDSALHHTSPIMIATLRALVGGALLCAMLPLMGSRLPRTRRLWAWALGIGLGNTTLTQVGISVGTSGRARPLRPCC